MKVGGFVIVQYEGQSYPGHPVKLPVENETGPTVNCMEKGKKFWKWPQKQAHMVYDWSDVKKVIKAPKLFKRGYFEVPELDNK